MRPRFSRTTGERIPQPPTSWLLCKGALAVLAALSPADRAAIMADPMSPRSWHLFRDRVAALDREYGSRRWMFDRPPRRDHGPPTTAP